MKDKKQELSDVLNIIKKCLANCPELVHCWRFLTGVVYALDEYYQIVNVIASTKMKEQEYIQEADNVLTSILNNQTPTENWLRGFYYNAALMRLDAAYERFFKAFIGKQGIDGPKLYKEIRNKLSSLFLIKKYEDSNFGKVRHEVNSLKHYVGGADLMEREKPEILQQALNELVALLNDPIVIMALNKFSEKGIITGRKYNYPTIHYVDPE